MRITPWGLVFVVLLSSALVGQKTPAKEAPASKPAAPKTAKEPRRPTAEYWLQAAERFTADITDEAWRLDKLDKALLDARLCGVWWRPNQLRAHTWCAMAVDVVSHQPQQEPEADRKLRLVAAREVMHLVAPLDYALGNQVQDAIELATRDAGGDVGRDREYLAMALASAAGETEDPERAARLISESLRAGGAFQTIGAVFKLGERDPARGEQSFAELLGWVRQTRNFEFANNLLREVFTPARNISVDWKQGTVETVTAMASVVPESERDRGYRCQIRSTIIGAGENIPQTSAAAIRAVLADCESREASAVAASRQGGPDLSELKTPDDYLRAAGETRDLQGRVNLKYMAAMRAETLDHDYERALDILDALSEEELRARPGMIPNMRIGFATRGAVYELEHTQDIDAALHICRRNPDNVRGSIELAVLIEAGQKQLSRGVLDVYHATLDDLRRFRSDDPNDYVKMANLSLRSKGEAGLNMMREMVRRIVEWEPLDPKSLKGMQRYFPPLETSLRPLPFVAELVDYDPDAVIATAKYMRNTKLRVSFDLGVLQHLTRRYMDEQRRSKPKPKTSPAG